MAAVRRRKSTADVIARLTGAVVQIDEVRNGWPSRASVHREGALVPVSLHVGTVGLSGRGRDAVERRYQNPEAGDPVTLLAGTVIPLVIGLWEQEETAVLVAHDGARRVGEPRARASLFAPLWMLRAAAAHGWAEHESDTGERLVAFLPRLFPVFFEIAFGGVQLPPREIQAIAEAVAPAMQPAFVERARRQATVLVRSQKFRDTVVRAYDGYCAMCGLDLGLVQGAHIYPASAPGSSDDAWNGIALCANHHAAFDQHSFWIEPTTLRVIVRPELRARAEGNASCASFVQSHFPQLTQPNDPAHRPRDEMFTRRYEFFDGRYDWAAAG